MILHVQVFSFKRASKANWTLDSGAFFTSLFMVLLTLRAHGGDAQHQFTYIAFECTTMIPPYVARTRKLHQVLPLLYKSVQQMLCYSSKTLRRQTSRASSRRRSGKISQHTRLGPKGVLILVRGAVSAKDRRGTVCYSGLMSSSHRILMSEANCYLSVKYHQTFAISTVQQTPLVRGRGAGYHARPCFPKFSRSDRGLVGDSGYVIWPPCGSSIVRRYIHLQLIRPELYRNP